ncbi:hypothetical protein I302_106964 [Kwoniella bestiolae CBS 10118]|uniref:Chitin synthase n=1 Tax=Kwoniella bestiolae CBS 10118 TaxID=1296100 RepID=A0AAJ8MAL0_9TREE
MPVSSRKPPPRAQPYEYLAPASHSQSTSSHSYSPAYTPIDSTASPRNPSPAPPYDNRFGANPDPFTGTRMLAYGPSGPANDTSNHLQQPYVPPYAAPLTQPLPPGSQLGSNRLPFFEAALARSRGQVSPEPTIQAISAPGYGQPLPSYLPPPDPNHPNLAVGFTQSNTVRFATAQNPSYNRETSRSPSPGLDESFDQDYERTYDYGGEHDVEKALLDHEDHTSNQIEVLGSNRWNEKSMGYIGGDDGDLSLPPLRGAAVSGQIIPPSIHIRGPTGSTIPSDIATSTTQHFGPAPTGRVGRRTHNAAGHRRIKQSATLDDNGFFAVDMPIPTRLAQFLPVKGVEEQKSTRYTAVTTDPDDFPTSGLRLRQNMTDPPRQTELFIVITMYNENAELFCRTLCGVMKNIAHLCGRKNSRVVVCIVADGRKAVNPRVLDCLAALGVYQEGAMTNKVKDRAVTAHVFEYTTSFALDADLHFKYPDKGIVPCQIIFCLKEKNAKKINSHRWFFNAFAPLLSPNVCILLDVGTRPALKSLYYLWKAFDLNSNVGGACGEIATFKGKTWRSLLNPLVAAQCFEYKMSNILDKPMESLFGYCSVLPGAFSAYRWIALQNNADGTGPLASYFQGENLHTEKLANSIVYRYLAEDRILCFEIVAKKKANWVLKFVKSAVGETDCPDTIPEFIAQRRRWLNGSFFAAVYSLIHVAQIWRSDHSLLRKLSLMLEFAYNALNLLFSWFSLANFYIFFVILTRALEGEAFKIPRIDILNSIAQVSGSSRDSPLT